MLWRAASVSGWREEKADVCSREAGTGELSRADAPGNDSTVEALKYDHEETLRTSHQKCLMEGSRRGKEMVRTRDAAGLARVRYCMRVVEGSESRGVAVAARASGDGARGR